MNKLEGTNLFLIIFFGVSLIIYFVLNAGAFAQNLWYSFYFDSPFIEDSLKNERILDFSQSALSSQESSPKEKTPLAAEPRTAESGPQKYQLIIPKIAVNVTIITPTGTSNKDVLMALEQGVGLYPGSGLPGEEGRAVILGHSSRASWYRGEYAYIFSLLPKLEVSDEFYITVNGEKRTYRVFSKRFLSPQKTNEVLSEKTSNSEVDLITCYPIGGASQRTLIQAKLVT